MKETIFCCCFPADKATRFVGIFDMVLGAACFMALSYNLKLLYSDDSDSVISYFGPRRNHNYSRRKEISWLTWACFLCSGVQCLMGGLLYRAAQADNLRMCRTWQYVAIATCFMTFPFIFRVHQVLIVADYIESVNQEIRSFQNAAMTTNLEHHRYVDYQSYVFQNSRQSLPAITETHELTVTETARPLNSAPPVYVRCMPSSVVPEKEEEEDSPPPYHIAVELPPLTKIYN